MQPVVNDIQQRLLALQDVQYRDFQIKLIPTIDPETIIGVRTPILRKLAKELSSTPQGETFVKLLPHHYYEENNLHAFLLEQYTDYSQTILALNTFLPYINNWATCDSLSPKSFKKNLIPLLSQIKIWLSSAHVYTVRFALGMLMRYYLDEAFQENYLALAAAIHSNEYYVQMMEAWFFATALAKQYDAAIIYLQENKLDPWVHNKTIQKAIESYRLNERQKEILRRLKRK